MKRVGGSLDSPVEERPLKQRIAARLLLACCTLAIGLGLGAAVAVLGVLGLQHPRLSVISPGQEEARLDRGVQQLFVLRDAQGGAAPVAESRPACTFTAAGGSHAAPAVTSDAGFAAVRLPRDGRYRVACTSAIPVTVDVAHEGEPFSAYLSVIARGLVPAVALTVLAAVLAARALIAVRSLPPTRP